MPNTTQVNITKIRASNIWPLVMLISSLDRRSPKPVMFRTPTTMPAAAQATVATTVVFAAV